MQDLLKPKKGSVKDRTRRGRGNASGLGGESGRGQKGQQSRSGYSKRFGFEGGQMPLYRRVPKKNGFNNINKICYAVINLSAIDSICQNGDVVDIQFLKEKRIIKNKEKFLKILGNGNLTKKITLRANSFSKSVEDKLKLQGSIIELVN